MNRSKITPEKGTGELGICENQVTENSEHMFLKVYQGEKTHSVNPGLVYPSRFLEGTHKHQKHSRSAAPDRIDAT